MTGINTVGRILLQTDHKRVALANPYHATHSQCITHPFDSVAPQNSGGSTNPPSSLLAEGTGVPLSLAVVIIGDACDGDKKDESLDFSLLALGAYPRMGTLYTVSLAFEVLLASSPFIGTVCSVIEDNGSTLVEEGVKMDGVSTDCGVATGVRSG